MSEVDLTEQDVDAAAELRIKKHWVKLLEDGTSLGKKVTMASKWFSIKTFIEEDALFDTTKAFDFEVTPGSPIKQKLMLFFHDVFRMFFIIFYHYLLPMTMPIVSSISLF